MTGDTTEVKPPHKLIPTIQDLDVAFGSGKYGPEHTPTQYWDRDNYWSRVAWNWLQNGCTEEGDYLIISDHVFHARKRNQKAAALRWIRANLWAQDIPQEEGVARAAYLLDLLFGKGRYPNDQTIDLAKERITHRRLKK